MRSEYTIRDASREINWYAVALVVTVLLAHCAFGSPPPVKGPPVVRGFVAAPSWAATPAPVGVRPGPGFRWAHLPGIGWGWVGEGVSATAAPTFSPAALPVVRFALPATSSSGCPGGVCPLPGR